MHLILSEQRWLRLSSFTAFYVAQGVPIGLVIALLPWLVSEGYGEADVAWFATWVSVPWAIKLLAGPVMDRFTMPAMGFRRPWALMAQAGLVLALVGLAFAGLADGSLLLLTVAGFVVNVFAATQDVAVDGMAIDILPVNERGRANAFMAFGQTFGRSAFAAICGYLVVNYGVAGAASVCAVAVAVIFGLVAIVRERPGEKLAPWSEGKAAVVERTETVRFADIFRDLLRVLFLPMSLLMVLVEFLNRVRDGVAVVVFPVIAVDRLGFTVQNYTTYEAISGLIAATIGLAVGPFIDRSGAKRYLMAALVGAAAVHLAFAVIEPWWGNRVLVVGLALASQILGQVVFVAIIALFMNLCWTRVAATQFAIYMSFANLSRTVGSALFALVAVHIGYQMEFLVMAGFLVASAVGLMLFDGARHSARLDELRSPGDGPSGPPPGRNASERQQGA